MTNIWILRACAVFAAAACLLSAAIALHTAPDTHPDELIHGDAFCYFQNHAWPPAPNLEGLRYSPDGMSRVYNGEIVYWLWGRAGAVISPLAAYPSAQFARLVDRWQPDSAASSTPLFLPFISTPYPCFYSLHIYRLLNTLLLAVTLAVLLYWGRRHPWPLLVAALVLCLPQVIYVYSYANSDAWGFSMSVFLFTFAVLTRKPLATAGSALLLGVLTALVVLSKQPFWLTLPFSYLWIAGNMWRQRRAYRNASTLRSLGLHIVLLVAVVVALIAPLKILYPLSIPDYRQQVELMREARSWPGWKPSEITHPGFRLAAQGFPFATVWRNSGWYTATMASLYGNFGYLTVRLPDLYYLGVGMLCALFLALTYWFGLTRRRLLPAPVKLALWTGPVFVALSVLASLYNSWTYDNQPQGRYLFAALLPLALMLAGTFPYEPHWSRTMRVAVWVAACLLCLAILFYYVAANPTFTR